jgi:hypothetical protein
MRGRPCKLKVSLFLKHEGQDLRIVANCHRPRASCCMLADAAIGGGSRSGFGTVRTLADSGM